MSQPSLPSGLAPQASDSTHVDGLDTKRPKSDMTLRVRGVPLDWDVAHLQTCLEEGDTPTGPVVKSLAREIDGSSSTGTVTFQNFPPWLQTLRPGKTCRILLPKPSDSPAARGRYLIFDYDFLGITTLYAPAEDDHKVDIVAISGLGGHAFGSFKDRNEDYMWLRDALPHDLTWEDSGYPMARVMTYGYESAVAQSKSIQNLEDLSTSFHNSLLELPQSRTSKPIILVAHSLGGLIVKQTLMSLSKSKSEVDKSLHQAVYGIVFFGVPHDGMDITSLIPMVGNRPNRFLVESISNINSQILFIQQREFHTALGEEGDSEIFCFYETEESPTAQQDEAGKWAMKGPAAILVTKSSATRCRAWENGPEHICAIARTHSNMMKFEPYDHEYRKALVRLKGLAHRSLAKSRRVQTGNAKFLVPYNRNPDFVERSEVLDKLKRQLGYGRHQRAANSRSRVSLHGLGGIGKTQIALAYVYWLHETCPDVSVFWVHASNAERFREAYTSIAEECNIPRHNDSQVDVLSLVKRFLERQYKSQWIMVIDNADDTELFFQPKPEDKNISPSDTATKSEGSLGRYIPECPHGSILVTTRNKQAGSRINQGKLPIEVGRMSDDEADQLVRAMLEDDEITKADTLLLSSRLEHLPLALAQAAAYIQENTMSIGDYIKLLDESDSSLVDRLSEPFEAVGRDSETPHSLTTTWIISFQQIKRRNPVASDVLALISLFNRQAIPEVFIADYYHRRWPEESAGSLAAATKAIGVLKAFSFISEGKDKSLDMHRLVQLTMRKWLVSEHRMAEFADWALETVSAAYPRGRFETREVCLKYLPHARAVLEHRGTGSRGETLERAELLHNVAGNYNFLGLWKDAEQCLATAVKLKKEILGEEHQRTLASMGDLQSAYLGQGLWKEAAELGLQVVGTAKRVLGTNHLDTLTCMSNLALTYSIQGQRKEAEELHLQVLEMHKEVLGAVHPNTLMSMNNLASTYSEQGQWKEAEELHLQVLEMHKEVLGAVHPKTLTSMNNLALTYSRQGRWKEAEELHLQVLEMHKEVLGAVHPNTLMSMNNLASTYSKQGQWKEAEELHLQVLEMRKEVLGTVHPDTLISMWSLAVTWGSQGRFTEATNLLRECVGLGQHLGTDDPYLAEKSETLAKWEEAEAMDASNESQEMDQDS